VWEPDQARSLEAAVRQMAAAAKILRLYPPSSQMPRQAVEAMLPPLSEFLATESAMVLSLARNGFTSRGEAIGKSIPGAADLSDHLRSLGVSDIEFTQGVAADDLLSFLTTIIRPIEEVQAEGGLAAVLHETGCRTIKVKAVSLIVADTADSADDQDVDEFLRALSHDPDQLAQWVSVAAKGDPAAFAEGLSELKGAAGSIGIPALLESLTQAFGGLDGTSKDALLDLATTSRDGADLAQQMVQALGTPDIAAALCEGQKGENLLSLSSTVTQLPLGKRLNEVLGNVHDIMAEQGHTVNELQFFDRMVELRSTGKKEAPLVEAQQSYAQMAKAATVSKDEIAQTLYEVPKAASRVNERTVQTMLLLLDQQNDFKLYCRSLENLSGMVPRLMAESQLDLADRILVEIDTRQASSTHPWPELGDKFRGAMATATSRDAMEALLDAVIADPGLIPTAKQMLIHGGEASVQTLVEASLDSSDPRALEIAGELVGRRLADFLTAAAPHAPAQQVATIIRHLAKDDHGGAQDAIESLIRRADEQSRREAARGLSDGGLAATKYLEVLAADESLEVATAAVRALGSIDVPTAAGALDRRLAAIQVDGKDFQLTKEIIAALGKLSDRSAAEALERLAKRRVLIKRGHFNEVRRLALDALAAKGATKGEKT
jgi:hypothetical protein